MCNDLLYMNTKALFSLFHAFTVQNVFYSDWLSLSNKFLEQMHNAL